MGKFIISKQFDFDYGHRVWTQTLDDELSCSAPCVCKHLHGHRGRILIHLESTVLNDQGMVVDFVNLNWFKKFLDEVLDHKMIVDMHDPLLPTLMPHYPADVMIGESIDKYFQYFDDGYLKPWMDIVKDEPQHIKELYEGMVLVEFVPTSENLAGWLHGIVQKRMDKLGVKVQRIQFYETPKSQSNYII